MEPRLDPSHWISHGSALQLAFSTLLDIAVTGLLLASTIVLLQRASVPAQAFSETITFQLRSISQGRLQVF